MLRLRVNLEHPNPRHITRAVDILRAGGLAVYPTDTTYGLGCDIYARRTIDRIYKLKGLNRDHHLSFLCSDLSQIAQYAVVEDHNYRILRHHLPGMYTFILPATREVPKVAQSKARTVGIRMPQSPVCLDLIRDLGHPLMSTTVNRNAAQSPDFLNDPDDITKQFHRSIEVLIDSGPLFGAPSSVIDLTGSEPVVLRKGSGPLDWFL